MKKFKYFIFIFVIFTGLFFLFGPEIIPENFQPQEILEVAGNSDVIIIFNSGGWGNTPLEKAKDFSPIVEGIQKTLGEWGYNTIVIPFNRTKNTTLGKITGVKEFFNSFKTSSKVLAGEIDDLTKKFPDKKIIIAGLSAGGAFANETIKKISDTAQNSVYAITAGTPFWTKTSKSKNILQLDNDGKDTLAKGDVKSLFSVLFRAPFQWLSSKINGQNLRFVQVFHAPGHDYSWSSSAVGLQITTFLENKFR